MPSFESMKNLLCYVRDIDSASEHETEPNARQVVLKNREDTTSEEEDKPQGLLTLPKELLLIIFDHLEPASSACLGLTCKLFYPMHIAKFGIVSLREMSKGIPLFDLLADLFQGLGYYGPKDMFVTTRRYWWLETKYWWAAELRGARGRPPRRRR